MFSPNMLNKILTVVLLLLILFAIVFIVYLKTKRPVILGEWIEPIAGASNEQWENEEPGFVKYTCEYMDGYDYKYFSIVSVKAYKKAMQRIRGEK